MKNCTFFISKKSFLLESSTFLKEKKKVEIDIQIVVILKLFSRYI